MAQACAIALGMSFSALVLANESNPGGPPAMTFEEGLALAKARACLGCHQVDNKRVGPSFRAIAQRRANQEDAVSYLVQVIRKGGRGQWGAVPMPGQSVSEQDAEKLAQWIISLGK
jgi:cytochrome c